ncbi:hypothetical protein ACE1CI_21715 [Aerosakkonemataceae cyanobacterium BLCC-F50]|uniref:Uncharacterized protein n=1 Tax=Floridaenema flaviceps BLCC-F50 TaxID=3153642 RepID=A0ABV4XWU7_9CYAN
MSLTDGKTPGRYQAEPEVLRNSLLELLFEPSELTSLVIVKPDPNDTSHDPLKNIDFVSIQLGNQLVSKVAIVMNSVTFLVHHPI